MNLKIKVALLFVSIIITTLYLSCSKDPAITTHYKTKNIIIIVVDGPRYSETWGLPSRSFIPHRASMLSEGVLCTRFYNNGYCYTNAGHTAITTGIYENIFNNGSEYPQNPSIFQYWLKRSNQPSEAWIIATKDKLEILSDCLDPSWKNKFRPMTDCGNAGLGSGYREDSTTFKNVKNILATNHPRMMLVNFKQPDASAHANDSLGYLQGIQDTDEYIYKIWGQIQNDPYYKNNTTLIVTNDHGRHTAGHLDGFVSHTDMCDGCKHIELFAIGPDFKKNYSCSEPYEQIDIATTVAELMEFEMPTSKGKVISDIFK